MARTTDPQKELFWKTHIQQAKYFHGSISEYCKHHGLQVHSFKYWKHRLANKTQDSRLPAAAFIPVRISPQEPATQKKSLPDAKWIAELIYELQARFA